MRLSASCAREPGSIFSACARAGRGAWPCLRHAALAPHVSWPYQQRPGKLLQDRTSHHIWGRTLQRLPAQHCPAAHASQRAVCQPARCQADLPITALHPEEAQHHLPTCSVMLCGFAPEEVELLWEHAAQVIGAGVHGPASLPVFVPVTPRLLAATVSELCAACRGIDAESNEGAPQCDAGHAVCSQDSSCGDEVHDEYCSHSALGRVAYFLPGEHCAYAPHFNDALLANGFLPAIVAAAQPKHERMMLHEALAAVRLAHSAYHGLRLPLETAGLEGPEAEALLRDVRPVLNVALDAAMVAGASGELRRDVSSVVVLDGLMTEEERRALLEWLTEEGHDHSGPPPESKWERACVDRAGDAATWGLQEHVLLALQEEPPAALVAVQSRLAALYADKYELCHMPVAALEEEGEDETPLSSFVGNAVVFGDPCHWHVDADPRLVPASSPWVEHLGQYANREPGCPLFVTALFYLNDVWPDEGFAETLFLDPATGTGVFCQPRPGRCILADQDVIHRIGGAAYSALGPRYSLVLKMVWWPRTPASAPTLARGEWDPPLLFGSAARL